jgi:hypothetical protein
VVSKRRVPTSYYRCATSRMKEPQLYHCESPRPRRGLSQASNTVRRDRAASSPTPRQGGLPNKPLQAFWLHRTAMCELSQRSMQNPRSDVANTEFTSTVPNTCSVSSIMIAVANHSILADTPLQIAQDIASVYSTIQ